jgi:type I restriction enzyme S subunit
MNATELLALYEQVADAPHAVTKLRSFVLDLAVRGKLVEQDASDEPASEFLKRIRKERQALGLLRALPLIDDDESVPAGWVSTTIGDFAIDVFTGPFGSMLHQADYVTGGVPLINPSHMKGDRIVADPKVSVARSTAKRLSAYAMRSGDIVMARRGEVGRAALVEAHQAGWLCGTGSFFLRLSPEVNRLYFLLQLRASVLRAYLSGKAVGTTMVNLNHGILKGAPLMIPPLAEQQRIVAKVDELMALCDQLEAARTEREIARDRLAAASLARLNAPDPDTFQSDAHFALNVLPALTTRPDQVKQLRQTILNLAVRGKLVPQDQTSQESQAATLSILERPADVPTGWGFEKLESLLSEDTRNGYSRRPDDAPNGTPILRISAGTVRRDGVVAEEEHKLISGIDQSVREQYGVRAGDLLACRFNGNKSFVGRLTLFEDYLGLRPIYPDKLIRVRVDPAKALATFIRYVGESDLIRSEVEAQCATTVGNWGISASNLKSIYFPVPPLAQQHQIVAKVDELMALCDKLEASLTVGEATRSRLLEALLHEALEPVANIAA